MSAERISGRGARWFRIGLALSTLGLVSVAANPAGAQIEGPCTATIAGQDASTATSPAQAIAVAHDATIAVAGADSTQAPYTRIRLRFPPLPAITVYDEPHDPPGPDWGGTVDVGDYATWGVGLYQVSGATDDCVGTAWIKVTGRSPLTTAAGIAGAALTALGLLGAGRSLVRARPGFGSLLRSLTGAVPAGVGAAVLAQQFAVTPLTGATVAAWTVGAASVTGLANLGLVQLGVGAAAS